MIVDGMIALADLVSAVAEWGGKIDWSDLPEGKVAPHRLSFKSVEVDDDEAAEALPDTYFDPEEEDGWLDPDDVRDITSALASGDRAIAHALAPRVFISTRNLAAFERGLTERRAA